MAPQNTSSAAVASLRTAAQTWRTDILVLFTASTSAMGSPYGMQKWRPQGIIRGARFASHCGPDMAYGHPGALHTIHIRDGFALRYAKMAAARDHPSRSARFALRCSPGIRTSWCSASHPHSQWACHAVRYAKMEAARGHPPRSHRFALRRRPGMRTSWFAKMTPARYHPPRSPRFALRRRSGVRTSWCPAQHPHPQWFFHTLSEHGAPNGSSAAVASLRTAAQTWGAYILFS